MLIKELIFEMSRASLYHFTTLERAVIILHTNILKMSRRYDTPDSVSLTRDQHYNIINRYEHGLSVRFELDQDKLRHNYKIKPYSWFWTPRDEDYEYYQEDEHEEIIHNNITDFDDYLLRIYIPNINEYSKHMKILFDRWLTHGGDGDKKKFYSNLFFINFLSDHPKTNTNHQDELKRIYKKFSSLAYKETKDAD